MGSELYVCGGRGRVVCVCGGAGGGGEISSSKTKFARKSFLIYTSFIGPIYHFNISNMIGK